MPERVVTVDEVFGVSRDVPLNYVARGEVDGKFIDSLSRAHHIVIYGSSKQGKTCLRKHCLKEDDYLVISCQNKWNLAELHSTILKECGYQVRQSTSRTVTGAFKIVASFEGKGKLPFVAEAKGGANAERSRTTATTETFSGLELDPYDVNDIIRALNEISLSRFIVLEDFHYLPDETQRDFSFALKAFHEKSKISFIIVGVWREENRLIAYNGDLTDRVYSVDVDTWTKDNLSEVLTAGEALLNVQFDNCFKTQLFENCFDSVHIVQEVARRCCRAQGVFQTQENLTTVGVEKSAKDVIRDVVSEQGGRYMGFLMNFADGFQQTDLEMPKWIIYAILKSSIEQLEAGMRLRDISRKIKSAHPKGDALNNGNITQALNSASSLQVKKNIRPIVVGYDGSNRNLHVVDKGFLIWLASQNVDELLEDLSLPLSTFEAE
jgi:hypothetical protein